MLNESELYDEIEKGNIEKVVDKNTDLEVPVFIRNKEFYGTPTYTRDPKVDNYDNQQLYGYSVMSKLDNIANIHYDESGDVHLTDYFCELPYQYLDELFKNRVSVTLMNLMFTLKENIFQYFGEKDFSKFILQDQTPIAVDFALNFNKIYSDPIISNIFTQKYNTYSQIIANIIDIGKYMHEKRRENKFTVDEANIVFDYINMTATRFTTTIYTNIIYRAIFDTCSSTMNQYEFAEIIEDISKYIILFHDDVVDAIGMLVQLRSEVYSTYDDDKIEEIY